MTKKFTDVKRHPRDGMSYMKTITPFEKLKNIFEKGSGQRDIHLDKPREMNFQPNDEPK